MLHTNDEADAVAVAVNDQAVTDMSSHDGLLSFLPTLPPDIAMSAQSGQLDIDSDSD